MYSLLVAVGFAMVTTPALARHGADDVAGNVRQCRGCDDPAGHIRQGRGADDAPGHVRHSGDDHAAGHQ